MSSLRAIGVPGARAGVHELRPRRVRRRVGAGHVAMRDLQAVGAVSESVDGRADGSGRGRGRAGAGAEEVARGARCDTSRGRDVAGVEAACRILVAARREPSRIGDAARAAGFEAEAVTLAVALPTLILPGRTIHPILRLRHPPYGGVRIL